MKHWCYYTRVVSYLEKLEALCAPNTKTAHFLVWTDDDGPHMIVGPGVEWYRGDGPMPELDGITAPAFPQTRNKRAARVSKRSLSKRPIRANPGGVAIQGPWSAPQRRTKSVRIS